MVLVDGSCGMACRLGPGMGARHTGLNDLKSHEPLSEMNSFSKEPFGLDSFMGYICEARHLRELAIPKMHSPLYGTVFYTLWILSVGLKQIIIYFKLSISCGIVATLFTNNNNTNNYYYFYYQNNIYYTNNCTYICINAVTVTILMIISV